jgi:hypothetical protein
MFLNRAEPAAVEALPLNTAPDQAADLRGPPYFSLPRSCFGDWPVTFLNVRLNWETD